MHTYYWKFDSVSAHGGGLYLIFLAGQIVMDTYTHRNR